MRDMNQTVKTLIRSCQDILISTLCEDYNRNSCRREMFENITNQNVESSFFAKSKTNDFECFDIVIF